MLSEDTGTQGRGNAELELGYEWDELSGIESLLFQNPPEHSRLRKLVNRSFTAA